MNCVVTGYKPKSLHSIQRPEFRRRRVGVRQASVVALDAQHRKGPSEWGCKAEQSHDASVAHVCGIARKHYCLVCEGGSAATAALTRLRWPWRLHSVAVLASPRLPSAALAALGTPGWSPRLRMLKVAVADMQLKRHHGVSEGALPVHIGPETSSSRDTAIAARHAGGRHQSAVQRRGTGEMCHPATQPVGHTHAADSMGSSVQPLFEGSPGALRIAFRTASSRLRLLPDRQAFWLGFGDGMLRNIQKPLTPCPRRCFHPVLRTYG
jgi:hypothetical protein